MRGNKRIFSLFPPNLQQNVKQPIQKFKYELIPMVEIQNAEKPSDQTENCVTSKARNQTNWNLNNILTEGYNCLEARRGGFSI